MIYAKVEMATDVGSCNFCSRQITPSGTDRTATVYHIRSDKNLSIRACGQCWDAMRGAVEYAARFAARGQRSKTPARP